MDHLIGLKKISLVPQQSFLYNETIKFNITFQEDEKKVVKTYIINH